MEIINDECEQIMESEQLTALRKAINRGDLQESKRIANEDMHLADVGKAIDTFSRIKQMSPRLNQFVESIKDENWFEDLRECSNSVDDLIPPPIQKRRQVVQDGIAT